MEPNLRYPFNVRSFFTDRETKDIGNGFVLWRGYFQSARPGIGQMLINVDISTGVMYKAGRLIDICLEFFGKPTTNPAVLANIPDREHAQLQRFLTHVRITTITPDGQVPRRNTPRGINKFTRQPATALSFQTREGQTLTVAKYFQQQYNRPLRFPNLPCVEVIFI
jgi:eukaryotic translation initiation factor 2C